MFEARLAAGAMRTQDDLAGVENSLGEDENAGKAAKARLLHMMKVRLRRQDSVLRRWVTRKDFRGRR